MTPAEVQLASADEQLWSLTAAMCDGTITAEGRDILEASLRASESARLFYAAYMDLHGRMLWRFRGGRGDTIAAGVQQEGPVAITAPVVPAKPSFFTLSGNTLHGTLGYFSEGWPVAYLIATLICGVSLLIGSHIYVSQPAQVARQPALPSTCGRGAGGEGSENAIHSRPTVGRITGMVDCKWETGSGVRGQGSGRVVSGQWPVASGQKQSESRFSSHEPPATSHLVSLGDKFALASGLMEISYDTGAKVILQGPVTYEVESAAGGFLSLGKLTARVGGREARGEGRVVAVNHQSSIINHQSSNPQSLTPNPSLSTKQYPPFTVKTPTAIVTDLGTEFGVEVSKEGRTQVHVLQGVVEAHRAGQQEGVQRLTEGMAIEIGGKGEQIKAVAFVPQSFTRKPQRATGTPAETAYIDAVLADKPMGYWPLNEPAGARRFFDRSGHGIHGYAMGKLAAGQPGPWPGNSGALALDGQGYIDLGRHGEFGIKNDFTVEAWVWIGDVAVNSTVVSAIGGDGSHAIGWALVARRRGAKSSSDNPVVLRWTTLSVKDFFLPPPRGEVIEGRWLHVAVVYDRVNTAHFYLNGTHRGSVAASKPACVGPVWLSIGCAEPGDENLLWRGRLAHVAVYPYSLSAQQIEDHYRQGNHGGKEVADKQP